MKNICHYCKEELEDNEITKDHIFPKSKIRKIISKGEELPEKLDLHNNKVLACVPCNNNKGTKDYDSFIMLGLKAIRHLKKQYISRIQGKRKNYFKSKRKYINHK